MSGGRPRIYGAVPYTPGYSSGHTLYEPPRSRTSGLGVAGFTVGLVGLLLSWVPCLNLVAVPFAVVGLALSVAGLAAVWGDRYKSRGLPIAGIVVSVLAMLLFVGVYTLLAQAGRPTAAYQHVALEIQRGEAELIEAEALLAAGALAPADAAKLRAAADAVRAGIDVPDFGDPDAADDLGRDVDQLWAENDRLRVMLEREPGNNAAPPGR